MRIDARKFDRLVTLERRSESFDDFGTPVDAWTPIATVAAQRVESTSREFVRTYGEAEEGEAVFRVRYLAGLTTADRIVFEGEELELVGIVELGRRALLELRTKTAQA